MMMMMMMMMMIKIEPYIPNKNGYLMIRRLTALTILIASQAFLAMEDNNKRLPTNTCNNLLSLGSGNNIQSNMISQDSPNKKNQSTTFDQAELSAIAILLCLNENTHKLTPKDTSQKNLPYEFNCKESGCTNNVGKGFTNQQNLNRHILKQHSKSSANKK
jgi:hypothetical protein